MKKISFFEKWNRDAGVKEFSLSRLLSALFAAFTAFFIFQFYIVEGNEVTVNSVVLVLVLLTASFMPKALKDYTDIKGKMG
ncbi:MAG: hypothetical protein KGY70_19080 [Bacteroidales bacterium]|nr:hypothetical protein [Bacteroidales bacterium]